MVSLMSANPKYMAGTVHLVSWQGLQELLASKGLHPGTLSTIWASPFSREKKKADWHGLIDKIKRKINAWGTGWLNPSGKIVLIRVVLSAQPIYACSISLAPQKTMKYITKEIKRFL